MDGVVVMIHDLGRDPVCVDKSLIRSHCVVAVVKPLKVLATCHELWVNGNPSNRSARRMDIPPTTHNLVFRTRTDVLSHPIYKDINRAIIYASGSSHAYIQQNYQDITTHIPK
jgi:hypothetical protein